MRIGRWLRLLSQARRHAVSSSLHRPRPAPRTPSQPGLAWNSPTATTNTHQAS